jgi:two-component system sensor histidine kinase GlrK
MLLKDLANTDEQKEFFELLDISIHRLESFALTAVQIAELQTLQSKLSKAPVHLNALIGEIGKVINFEQHHRKLSVKTNIGNEVIFVNRALFITALTKIFENAVRFSPMDGVITMTVTPESDGIHFVIEDEGPGFPHEVLLHKFEPFVSGDTHIDQNPAISLSMVRFIIEAHGGKIDIFNPRTGGAAVDFYLPEHG